jgi:cation diffusion facilitator family transporter
MSSEKETVALNSIIASALMTVGKFAVGMATGSLGLVSEGAHSLIDMGATVMTYLAVRVSDKPADREHPYGHGKIESVTALAETVLLLMTSGWIVIEAIHRLRAGAVEVETTWWSVAVVVASIAIDIHRAAALTRVAKETRSQALEADALHFSSDILSSTVVLFGLGVVWLGYPTGDTIAAIGVALFVCLAGVRLGRRTIDTLIDAAPHGAAERIEACVLAVPGVVEAGSIRVRPAGSVLFVDIDVAVSRTLPLERVAAIKDDVVAAIQADMPEAEVTVITRPLALNDETVLERVMVIAANRRLAVHHVTVQHVGDRLSVAFDLEVDGRLPLGDAHRTASDLERAIRGELGGDVEVETHIEPLAIDPVDSQEADPVEVAAIRKSLSDAALALPQIREVHDVRARQTVQGMYVTFHCLADPALEVEEVHEHVDQLERAVRKQWPAIRRIIGHVEPART